MRKIILMMSVSFDGFFEGPNREIDWHMVDDELHRHFNAELGAMGGFLDGRVTWELMAAYWPTADQDPANAGPKAEFVRIWREMPKWVFSRTLREAGWNTRIVHAVVPEEIRQLQRETRGDLVVGGAELASEFMRQDLIDEYRIYAHPIILGSGRARPATPVPANRRRAPAQVRRGADVRQRRGALVLRSRQRLSPSRRSAAS